MIQRRCSHCWHWLALLVAVVGVNTLLKVKQLTVAPVARLAFDENAAAARWRCRN